MALTARHATIPSLPAVAFRAPRFTHLRAGIISALVFLIALVDALLHPTTGFDLWAIKAIQGINAPGLPTFVDRVNTLTGSDGAVAVWAGTLLLFLAIRWWVPALGLLTLPAGGVINYVIGEYVVSRTRPGLPELERATPWVNERSFPSGHVMGAIMFYGFLFVVARRIRYPGLRLAVQGFSAGTIVAVGFARVWHGAHWLTDVIGAYALGGLLLAGLLAVYTRLDAAVGDLPLIRAASLPHDESRPHAHALTSLVLFEGETVAKVYAPGLLPRAIYWLAFQAPFPYVANRAGLAAAIHRRNLAGLLAEYWYGETRVARALGIEHIDGRLALRSEFVAGHEPVDRAAARAFLTDLRGRFDEAGLPTWQIDPRQPRAIDNVLETADGTYRIVDLESGLVSPLASRRTWGRALHRGLVPFYDEVFFDVTRAYVAQEEPHMRATLGDARFADLVATLDAAERETARWQAQEPRLWSRLLRGLMTGFGVKTWKRRVRARVAGSHEWGLAWMDRAVATWETEGRI
ncbi:MAG: phosphatase PAP2 family protein, partial [Chloroflexota bacterium]|nr:phosphatase PAP2 family protein [Chloroflexota bacterium]